MIKHIAIVLIFLLKFLCKEGTSNTCTRNLRTQVNTNTIINSDDKVIR